MISSRIIEHSEFLSFKWFSDRLAPRSIYASTDVSSPITFLPSWRRAQESTIYGEPTLFTTDISYDWLKRIFSYYFSLYTEVETTQVAKRLTEIFDMASSLSAIVRANFADYLEGEIRRKYQRTKQVEAIYIEHDLKVSQIIILLSSDQYDDDLMDRLLDIEYDVHKQFAAQMLSFSYIPLLDRKQDSILEKL
ncbi:MAG: hypothetical protein ACUVV0_05220 [Anaerolineae bacterium]